MMTTKKGDGGLDRRAPEPTAVDDAEIRAAMVAAVGDHRCGLLERLPDA